jgi:hypothetical protein
MFASHERWIWQGHGAAEAISDTVLYHAPERCSLASFQDYFVVAT